MDKCECPDLDVKKGCGKALSCSHACYIRWIGLDQNDCNKECKKQWDSVQSGQGQCAISVRGHSFDLCAQCTSDRPGSKCSNPAPLSECQKGCSQYEDQVIRQKKGWTVVLFQFFFNKSPSQGVTLMSKLLTTICISTWLLFTWMWWLSCAVLILN